MDKLELYGMIAGGEDSFTEFKRDVTQRTDFADEMIALANTEGGRILIGVEDDGLPTVQLMIEYPGEPSVPALGHAAGLVDCLAGLRIVVNIEMFGLQYFEVEALVLDLVPPEILRAGRRRPGPQPQYYSHE